MGFISTLLDSSIIKSTWLSYNNDFVKIQLGNVSSIEMLLLLYWRQYWAHFSLTLPTNFLKEIKIKSHPFQDGDRITQVRVVSWLCDEFLRTFMNENVCYIIYAVSLYGSGLLIKKWLKRILWFPVNTYLYFYLLQHQCWHV